MEVEEGDKKSPEAATKEADDNGDEEEVLKRKKKKIGWEAFLSSEIKVVLKLPNLIFKSFSDFFCICLKVNWSSILT